MTSRNWVKVYCNRWFEGSIRKETPELRSIWVDLLALAGRTGNNGVIRLPGTELGFTDLQLATIFNVPVELWLSIKARLANHPDGEHENRIRVNDCNKIEIINWGQYQSEYARQLPYREKLQLGVSVGSDGENRRDKNRLEENRSKESKTNKFIIPTVQEVADYCTARRNTIDPEHFHAHYTTRDWRLKDGQKMSNWKSAVVTWEKNQRNGWTR